MFIHVETVLVMNLVSIGEAVISESRSSRQRVADNSITELLILKA